MSQFRTDTQLFTGQNCGAEYVHDPDQMRQIPVKNPGVRLTSVRPWPEEEGYESVTVDTQHGPLYFQFNMVYDESGSGKKFPDDQIREYYQDGKYNQLTNPRGEIVLPGIHHHASYDRVEIKSGEVVLFTVNNEEKAEYAVHYRKVREELRIKPGFKLLFESKPFYNWVHSERKYPSLVLFVLEKL